ncbi:MAG: hypothetical protein ACFFDI_16080 [Promethearchaeota archaeon]
MLLTQLKNKYGICLALFHEITGAYIIYRSQNLSPEVTAQAVAWSMAAGESFQQSSSDYNEGEAIITIPDIKKMVFFYFFLFNPKEKIDPRTELSPGVLVFLADPNQQTALYNDSPLLSSVVRILISLLRPYFSRCEPEGDFSRIVKIIDQYL